MRYTAKRDASEKAIVDALRKAGCSVLYLDVKDGPDFLLGHQGVTYTVEVKTGKAKLRDGQATWAATWRGSKPIVLRTVDEALALIGTSG